MIYIETYALFQLGQVQEYNKISTTYDALHWRYRYPLYWIGNLVRIFKLRGDVQHVQDDRAHFLTEQTLQFTVGSNPVMFARQAST